MILGLFSIFICCKSENSLLLSLSSGLSSYSAKLKNKIFYRDLNLQKYKTQPSTPSIIHIEKSKFNNIEHSIYVNNAEYKPSMKRKQYTDMKIQLENTRFDNCYTDNNNGGAICAKNCNIKLNSCIFFKCRSINGGAVYIEGGNLILQDCSAISCNSNYGSAYFINKTVASINSGFILKCKSKFDGAIYILCSEFDIQEIKLYNNVAEINYAGVCIDKSNGLCYSLYFYQNTANDKFGKDLAILSSKELIFEKSNFYGDCEGAVAYTADSNVQICTLKSNTNKLSLIHKLEQGSGGNHVVMLNTFGKDVPSLPEIPFEFDSEIFSWSIIDSEISFERIYIIGVILLIGFLIILYNIPRTIAHPIQEVKWQKV